MTDVKHGCASCVSYSKSMRQQPCASCHAFSRWQDASPEPCCDNCRSASGFGQTIYCECHGIHVLRKYAPTHCAFMVPIEPVDVIAELIAEIDAGLRKGGD